MGVLPGAVVPNIRQYELMMNHNRTLAKFDDDERQYGSLNFLLDNLAFALPLGIALSSLSLLTFFGNAMVVHAIRTERKLHTVNLEARQFHILGGILREMWEQRKRDKESYTREKKITHNLINQSEFDWTIRKKKCYQ